MKLCPIVDCGKPASEVFCDEHAKFCQADSNGKPVEKTDACVRVVLRAREVLQHRKTLEMSQKEYFQYLALAAAGKDSAIDEWVGEYLNATESYLDADSTYEDSEIEFCHKKIV